MYKIQIIRSGEQNGIFMTIYTISSLSSFEWIACQADFLL